MSENILDLSNSLMVGSLTKSINDEVTKDRSRFNNNWFAVYKVLVTKPNEDKEIFDYWIRNLSHNNNRILIAEGKYSNPDPRKEAEMFVENVVRFLQIMR